MTGASRQTPAPRWRGFVFNTAFYAWTMTMLPIGLTASIRSTANAYVINRVWANGALWLLSLIVGLQFQVRGRENVPDESVMMAVKHQSAWETLALNLELRDPAFVVKRELMRVPVFGWLLHRVGMISVDRSGGGAALRSMVGTARQRVAEGRSIVIFPEGTRTPLGERQPYHPGVAALYKALNVPVIPVALNSGLFWPRRSTWLQPGVVTLEFLPAIPPGLPRRDFMAQLETAIEDASDRLADEARDIHAYL